MENKELYQFYEDVCNLGRVLPNLAASVIYTELNNFKDKPDRVQLILKKYFSSYEPEVHNCMSDDIKKIKRVVPNYPFIHINNDLLGVEDKDNRVQLVLKSYFDTQLKLSKRSSDDSETEASPAKKLKTDDVPTDILFEQANSSQNYPTTSETESYTLASDDVGTSQLEKSENNDQNSNIVIEKEHNLDEIPVVSTSNIQNFDISQQPAEQTVEINKDSDNQNLCNSPEKPSILSLLSNLFPQHSSEILKIVCENYAVVPDDPPDEATMNMMVQVMLNQNINDEAFEQVNTEICENQIPVYACSSAETNEKILTQEDGLKENEDINLPVAPECDKQLLEGFENSNQECSTESYKFDELQDYFQEVVNGFVLDLSRTTDTNAASNNSIIKPATFHPKQNTISTLSNTATGQPMKPTKPILKPSMLHRNPLSTNFNTGSKPQNNTSTASGFQDHHNHRLSSKSKPILRPSILQRHSPTTSTSRLSKGSNDTLQNKITIDPRAKLIHNHTPSCTLKHTQTTTTKTDHSPLKHEEISVANVAPASNNLQITQLYLNENTSKSHVDKKEPVKIATVVSTGAIKKSASILTGTSNSSTLLKGNDINKNSKYTYVIKVGPSKNISNLPNSNYNSDSKNTKTSGPSKNIINLNTTKSHVEKKEPVKTVTVVSTGAIKKSNCVIKTNNAPGPSNSISNLPNSNNNSDPKKDKNILQLNTKTSGPSKNIINLNTTKSLVEKKEPVKTATVVSSGAIKKSHCVIKTNNASGLSKIISNLPNSNNNSDPKNDKNILQLNTKTSGPSNLPNSNNNSDSKKDKNILELNTKTSGPSKNIISLNTSKSVVEKKEPVKTATVVSTGAIKKSHCVIKTNNASGPSKIISNLPNSNNNSDQKDKNILQLNTKTSGPSNLPNSNINSDSKKDKNILPLNTKTLGPSKNINNPSNSNSEEGKNILQLNTKTNHSGSSVIPKVIILKPPESNIMKTNNPKLNNFVQGPSDCRPSTSGLKNRKVNAIDTSPQSSIRVRTDLYDMYFNGPVYDSSSESSCEKDDDVVIVSVDRVASRNIIQNDNDIVKVEENSTDDTSSNPSYNEIISLDDTSRNILPNAEASNNEIVKLEETSTDSEEPSTSKIQPPTDAQATHPFYFKLLEIFPDICPDYLKKLCNESTGQQQTMDDMVSVLLNGDYKKRDRPASPENALDFEEQHKILQDLFPDADPSYLQHHCERLIDNPENFKHFVSSLLETKNYPTKADYLKKMKLSAQEKQYTTEFNVEKFLEVIPNPEEHFNDPSRRIVSEDNYDDTNYAITFLKNTFCTTVVRDIISVFRKSGYSVIKSAQKLETLKNMKTKRRPYPVTSCKNIPLLQEIAYVKHKQEILMYLRKKELEKQVARERVKSAGLMKTCQCCYDDEIMPEDIETCESGKHIFCKECIKRGCEVIIGDGKLDFPCLETCDSFFTLQVLQNVLTPKVFSKMALRKQMEEVKSAGIEDLESCPFCDFATIPAPGDKIFRCLNDDCMKESCRLCKEPSHIPLRCDEVEKDKDVKMRTYIENKMTEALVRKCYKCGLKFIKESGCNKMTCSCGAMMCYVCNKPVTDYKHFNGQGGDQFHLCPLYSDTHKLHMDAIKQSAESALKELGVNNTNELKIDPTTDIEQHYRRLAEQNPAIPNVQMVFPNNINVVPNVIPR